MQSYEASGRYNPSTLIIGLGLVIVVAAIAWPYQFLVDWIPYVYTSGFVLAGFAIAVYFVVKFGLGVAKCRSLAVAIAIGVVVALGGVWASHYFAYVRSSDYVATLDVYQEEEPGITGAVLRNRYGMLLFNRYYAEEFGKEVKFKRRRQFTVSGFGLYAVWMVEALVIAGAGVWGARGCASSPFCEACNEWCDREEMDVALTKVGRDAVSQAMSAESLEQLLSVGGGTDNTSESELHYKVHLCRTCSGSAYLTVLHKETIIGDDDKEKSVTRTLHKNIALSKKELKAMRGFKKLHQGDG